MTELNSDTVGLIPVTGQGKPYPVFNVNQSRIKERDGRPALYWTRSSGMLLSHVFCIIDVNGYDSSANATTNSGVAFGFCL
jgi:hypothetical protein